MWKGVHDTIDSDIDWLWQIIDCSVNAITWRLDSEMQLRVDRFTVNYSLQMPQVSDIQIFHHRVSLKPTKQKTVPLYRTTDSSLKCLLRRSETLLQTLTWYPSKTKAKNIYALLNRFNAVTCLVGLTWHLQPQHCSSCKLTFSCKRQ